MTAQLDAPGLPHVLREYALVADGERGAVIGPQGDIAWLCAPRWDSPAVFSTLWGGGGSYVVTPSDGWHVWGGRYEDRSLIWRSRWVTSQGGIEVREALALPAEPDRLVLLRRVEAPDRLADLQVRLDPRADFGRKRLRSVRRRDDCWVARVGDLHLRWQGGADAEMVDGALVQHLRVPQGRSHDLVLEISTRPFDQGPPDPDQMWSATAAGWGRRVPALTDTAGGRDASQSYAVLSGLTSGTGGMVAAATASLPERMESQRNYDYRYCWIRDQCYAGRAVAQAGPYPLLDSAVEFVSGRLLDHGTDLRPAYTVDGDDVPSEETVEGLPGYPGGGRRIGNHINQQWQLDAFGEALLLIASAARHDRVESRHWQAAEKAVAAVVERAGRPEAGLWELGDARWTHSRLICAAGLKAIGAVAPSRQAADWTALADSLVADAGRDSVHPSGRWQRTPEDPRVDASLLLPAIRGAVPPDDPRSIATLDAVLGELTSEGYVYRFRHDDRPLHEAEGAFVLCGFITSLALHQQGRDVEARLYYERNRSACGPPGLFSEEFDVRQHQLRGNLPQAFVHALMLESSARLAQDWQQETDSGKDTR